MAAAKKAPAGPPLTAPGQRCVSEREPELGLGVVDHLDRSRITVRFPATGEQRSYAATTTVLKRVQFRPGETIRARAGDSFEIVAVEETGPLLIYVGPHQRVREDEIADGTSVSLPTERLMAGQADRTATFDLRRRTLAERARLQQSPVRGFLGGRLELIPHQFYILHEVASRQQPRVLLADEVGLGKTIEACLIVQRLLAIGRAQRILILVPESLVHQWLVELLRRFNLWFSIYDEDRCRMAEEREPGKNPFLDSQLALVSIGFLAGHEARREQAVAAGWDVIVVDEAHHLTWTPEAASPAYTAVEQLAARTPGLLLLTATPAQLGAMGHFARLRLLDPSRYSDYASFAASAERYVAVAEVADRIFAGAALSETDQKVLREIFNRDAERLTRHLHDLSQGQPGARQALLRTLLDQYGPGRVMFRNTRSGLAGFPSRQYHPTPLRTDEPALQARVARELEAEESGTAEGIRYSYRDDPRIEWLATFLREIKPAKVLLICRSARKVTAIENALKEKIHGVSTVFHEGLALVLRDRNAAWFAEPGGAQILLCSEIGSEGRNFQFAHHLVLFDLPLNPGLIEQRIGRLDRIGQRQTIHLHVPYLVGTCDEVVAEWYHRGLNALEAPLQGGEAYEAAFRARVLDLALRTGGTKPASSAELDRLIEETSTFRSELSAKLARGRDRLLELNSFQPEAAAHILDLVRAGDADTSVRRLLFDLLDHFGVRIRDFEGGDVFLDPSHAYIEGFPSIPREGMLATFDRSRAIAREDMRFLSADHPLVRDAMDLLIASHAGTTAFAVRKAPRPNLVLETVHVLEPFDPGRSNTEQFLAPQPVRTVVDLRGQDLTEETRAEDFGAGLQDGDLHRFLEKPGFNHGVLKAMIEGATDLAQKRSEAIRRTARANAVSVLNPEIDRLRALAKINDHIRAEEVQLAQTQLEQVCRAIDGARLRLDSVRLVMEGGA